MSEQNPGAPGAGPAPDQERPAPAPSDAAAATSTAAMPSAEPSAAMPAAPPIVKTEQLTQTQVVERLTEAMAGFVNMTWAGCFLTFTQTGAPPALIFEAFCRATGRVAGTNLSIGNLVDLMRVRDKCREGFNEAMKAVEMKQAISPGLPGGAPLRRPGNGASPIIRP